MDDFSRKRSDLQLAIVEKTEIQYYTPENCLYSRNRPDSPPEKPEISENTGNWVSLPEFVNKG